MSETSPTLAVLKQERQKDFRNISDGHAEANKKIEGLKDHPKQQELAAKLREVTAKLKTLKGIFEDGENDTPESVLQYIHDSTAALEKIQGDLEVYEKELEKALAFKEQVSDFPARYAAAKARGNEKLPSEAAEALDRLTAVYEHSPSGHAIDSLARGTINEFVLNQLADPGTERIIERFEEDLSIVEGAEGVVASVTEEEFLDPAVVQELLEKMNQRGLSDADIEAEVREKGYGQLKAAFKEQMGYANLRFREIRRDNPRWRELDEEAGKISRMVHATWGEGEGGDAKRKTAVATIKELRTRLDSLHEGIDGALKEDEEYEKDLKQEWIWKKGLEKNLLETVDKKLRVMRWLNEASRNLLAREADEIRSRISNKPLGEGDIPADRSHAREQAIEKIEEQIKDLGVKIDQAIAEEVELQKLKRERDGYAEEVATLKRAIDKILEDSLKTTADSEKEAVKLLQERQQNLAAKCESLKDETEAEKIKQIRQEIAAEIASVQAEIAAIEVRVKELEKNKTETDAGEKKKKRNEKGGPNKGAGKAGAPEDAPDLNVPWIKRRLAALEAPGGQEQVADRLKDDYTKTLSVVESAVEGAAGRSDGAEAGVILREFKNKYGDLLAEIEQIRSMGLGTPQEKVAAAEHYKKVSDRLLQMQTEAETLVQRLEKIGKVPVPHETHATPKPEKKEKKAESPDALVKRAETVEGLQGLVREWKDDHAQMMADADKLNAEAERQDRPDQQYAAKAFKDEYRDLGDGIHQLSQQDIVKDAESIKRRIKVIAPRMQQMKSDFGAIQAELKKGKKHETETVQNPLEIRKREVEQLNEQVRNDFMAAQRAFSDADPDVAAMFQGMFDELDKKRSRYNKQSANAAATALLGSEDADKAWQVAQKLAAEIRADSGAIVAGVKTGMPIVPGNPPIPGEGGEKPPKDKKKNKSEPVAEEKKDSDKTKGEGGGKPANEKEDPSGASENGKAEARRLMEEVTAAFNSARDAYESIPSDKKELRNTWKPYDVSLRRKFDAFRDVNAEIATGSNNNLAKFRENRGLMRRLAEEIKKDSDVIVRGIATGVPPLPGGAEKGSWAEQPLVGRENATGTPEAKPAGTVEEAHTKAEAAKEAAKKYAADDQSLEARHARAEVTIAEQAERILKLEKMMEALQNRNTELETKLKNLEDTPKLIELMKNMGEMYRKNSKKFLYLSLGLAAVSVGAAFTGGAVAAVALPWITGALLGTRIIALAGGTSYAAASGWSASMENQAKENLKKENPEATLNKLRAGGRAALHAAVYGTVIYALGELFHWVGEKAAPHIQHGVEYITNHVTGTPTGELASVVGPLAGGEHIVSSHETVWGLLGSQMNLDDAHRAVITNKLHALEIVAQDGHGHAKEAATEMLKSFGFENHNGHFDPDLIWEGDKLNLQKITELYGTDTSNFDSLAEALKHGTGNAAEQATGTVQGAVHPAGAETAAATTPDFGNHINAGDGHSVVTGQELNHAYEQTYGHEYGNLDNLDAATSADTAAQLAAEQIHSQAAENLKGHLNEIFGRTGFWGGWGHVEGIESARWLALQHMPVQDFFDAGPTGHLAGMTSTQWHEMGQLIGEFSDQAGVVVHADMPIGELLEQAEVQAVEKGVTITL